MTDKLASAEEAIESSPFYVDAWDKILREAQIRKIDNDARKLFRTIGSSVFNIMSILENVHNTRKAGKKLIKLKRLELIAINLLSITCRFLNLSLSFSC